MKRYKSYFDMMAVTKEQDISQYICICLEDYADFIETTGIAISLDSFISNHWNIIPYYDFVQLKPTNIVYVYEMNRLEPCMVFEYPFTNTIDEERTTIYVEDVGHTIMVHAGMVYFTNSRYDMPINIKESTRKEETKCQQMKTVLITKTSQHQN